MNILIAAVAIAAAQTASPAPVDHSRHTPAQHAQHKSEDMARHAGEHQCCKQVNGKMECQMMKGHKAGQDGKADAHGHEGH